MRASASAAFTPEALNASGNISCLVDSEYRIVFCNRAWDSFALENDGAGCLRRAIVGCSLFDAIPQVLRPYYLRAFQAAQSSRVPFAVDYECSEPDTYRLFRMQIFPLLPEGYAVVHSLRVEHPHKDPGLGPSEIYRGAEGIITMCAHCRRTRRATEPTVWDWVPEYLRSKTLRVSHGLCPPCHHYFYGDCHPDPGSQIVS
jgi:hypothetical protein